MSAFANARALIASPLHRSVIRRSMVLLSMAVPGFLLNYLLLYIASRTLVTEHFGILYTCITVINILYTPSTIVSFFFSRQISETMALHGVDEALNDFRFFFGKMMFWCAVLSVVILVPFTVLGSIIGVDSYALIVLIVLANYGNYLMETIRGGFQGLQRFFTLGAAGLSWIVFRFIFGTLGIYLFRTVWAGVTGIMLCSAPALLLFHRVLMRGRTRSGSLRPMFFPKRKFTLFIAGFGLLSLLMYMDVLMAYLSLDKISLSAYSASSILPKSIIMVLNPLMQVLFPLLVTSSALGQSSWTKTIKGIALTAAASLSGALFLDLFADILCSTSLGIKSCMPGTMVVLGYSVIPVCLLRVLTLILYARNIDWGPLLLIVPVSVFMGWVVLTDPDASTMAAGYLAISSCTLVAFAAISLYLVHRRAACPAT